MPLYTVSNAAPLSNEQRQQLATLIMQTHCEITQAPPTFVSTVFSQGAPISRKLRLHILGNVRKGRSNETNAELTRRLRQVICAQFEWPLSQVHIALIEVPASWVMEGGEILPEPGQEVHCSWLHAQHAERNC